MSDWQQAATVLLGTRPAQVASWGREGLAAYVAELEARGLSPERAISAIRASDAEFPPAAGRLAAKAAHDPQMPTFAEAYQLIYGRGGVLRARPHYLHPPITQADHDDAARRRATEFHPSIGAFIRSQGLTRLRMLHVDDPDHGELVRKQLGEQWEQFCDANDHRDLAALSTGDLHRFDPLAALSTRSSDPSSPGPKLRSLSSPRAAEHPTRSPSPSQDPSTNRPTPTEAS